MARGASHSTGAILETFFAVVLGVALPLLLMKVLRVNSKTFMLFVWLMLFLIAAILT